MKTTQTCAPRNRSWAVVLIATISMVAFALSMVATALGTAAASDADVPVTISAPADAPITVYAPVDAIPISAPAEAPSLADQTEPVDAVPISTPIDSAIPPYAELEDRISGLENSWQHLRISGGISLGFSAYQGRLPGEITTEENPFALQPFPSKTQIGIENQLSLSLQAAITDKINAYARFGGNGLWGVNYPGELALAPVSTPVLMMLQEFAAAYSTDTLWILAGKQTFGLGPLGLLVSNTSTPIDLIDATIAGRGVAASAIIGRLSSEYYMGTDYVIGTDDYLAARIEKQLTPSTVIGVNGLLSGVGNASGQSIDLQSRLLGRPFVLELARYNPGSTITEDSGQDAYAWLARINLLNTEKTQASVTYGRAGKGFTPAFSSIASSAGATENLLHNSQNLTLDVSRDLGSGFSLAGQVSVSRFLDQQYAAETLMNEGYPLLSASVTASKQIAPYSVVNATVSHHQNDAVNFRRFGVDLQLNF